MQVNGIIMVRIGNGQLMLWGRANHTEKERDDQKVINVSATIAVRQVIWHVIALRHTRVVVRKVCKRERERVNKKERGQWVSQAGAKIRQSSVTRVVVGDIIRVSVRQPNQKAKERVSMKLVRDSTRAVKVWEVHQPRYPLTACRVTTSQLAGISHMTPAANMVKSGVREWKSSPVKILSSMQLRKMV